MINILEVSKIVRVNCTTIELRFEDSLLCSRFEVALAQLVEEAEAELECSELECAEMAERTSC